MGDRSPIESTEQPPRTRRLRLWHLAVAVFVSALLLAGIRASFVGVVGLFVFLASATLLMCFVFGWKSANRAGLALLEWGDRRGGLAGFIAPVLYVVAYMLAGLLAIVVSVFGSLVLIGLLMWFLRDY